MTKQTVAIERRIGGHFYRFLSDERSPRRSPASSEPWISDSLPRGPPNKPVALPTAHRCPNSRPFENHHIYGSFLNCSTLSLISISRPPENLHTKAIVLQQPPLARSNPRRMCPLRRPNCKTPIHSKPTKSVSSQNPPEPDCSRQFFAKPSVILHPQNGLRLSERNRSQVEFTSFLST